MKTVPWEILTVTGVSLMLATACMAIDTSSRSTAGRLELMGNRFFTFSTVVRVRQIEASREEAHGPDESAIQTPREARVFRDAIDKAWPGARITWAFSWLALHDERDSYRELRDLVAGYHRKYGDEITFIPGAYFSNMYNTREQVNRDLHDGLKRVTEIVGGGYRPKSVVADSFPRTTCVISRKR